MIKVDNCRRVATRHGEYWHAFPPGERTAVCGIAWPIFPARGTGHRDMCPRCRAFFAGGGVAVEPAEREVGPLVVSPAAESEPKIELRLGGRRPGLYVDGVRIDSDGLERMHSILTRGD